MNFDINKYHAKAIRLISEDGKLYNLVDLLQGGAAGNDGKSAYEVAVDNGFEGTEGEWLESLNGQPGVKGDPFTFDDFTEEQLESLRGPEGPAGNDAEPQFTEEQAAALLDLIDGDG